MLVKGPDDDTHMYIMCMGYAKLNISCEHVNHKNPADGWKHSCKNNSIHLYFYMSDS